MTISPDGEKESSNSTSPTYANLYRILTLAGLVAIVLPFVRRGARELSARLYSADEIADM